MTFSFQKRLLLGVLVLVSTITVTLAFVGVEFGSSFLRTRFDDRMHFLARHLALNAELGILLGDLKMLRKNADNVLVENDVVRVWIEDEKGAVIFKAGKLEDKKNKEAVAVIIQQEQEEDQAFIYNTEQNKVLGKVHLVYSTAGIDSLLSKFRNLHIVVGFVAGLIGLLVFFFFSLSLVNPIKGLVEATKQVRKGNLNVRVDEGPIPELQHLAHAFNNMLTALKYSRRELNRVHRQVTEQKALAEVGLFSFTVAHEVKNPLGIIKGALDVLKKVEVDDETKSTMISYMEEEIVRLNRLVHDFLNFSRPQKPTFKNINLCDLLLGIVERSRLEWSERGVNLHTVIAPQECIIEADEDLLTQAILNVLRNACQACEDDGEVFVSLNVADDYLHIKIKDTGKGMAPEVKEKACVPFFTTKSQGSGLGLAFVERVVRVHDGKIDFSNNKDGGTAVTLTLKKSLET